MKSGVVLASSVVLFGMMCPAWAVQDAASGSLGGSLTVADDGPLAYMRMALTVPESQRESFVRGERLFRTAWQEKGGTFVFHGLGPLYNRLSCVGCHTGNGAGFAPSQPQEPMLGMLVRLSVPGQGPYGEVVPDPVYGDQFNNLGVRGVPGEGRTEVLWHTTEETLVDGTVVALRRPEIQLVDLNYGPLGDGIMLSPRIGQPIYGLGLLEAVSEADLIALADPKDQSRDGISGRVNRVWDPEQQRIVAGRFGWKANQPSLKLQIVSAMLGDMGITSSLLPQQNCTEAQTACRAAATADKPELTDEQVEDLLTYHRGLGVPARRKTDDPVVQAGEKLFASLGCNACHRESLRTADGMAFHPYTDLLLHDMGAGLADGRPDFLASGTEWRTPPLWGIGLRAVVDDRAGYLHDGRGRTLLEAILWHGGEAQAAADRVRALSTADRQALLVFLGSL